VNKRSTKAELRFNVNQAHWMPAELRVKFTEIHANRINNEGFVVISCQKYRTQPENERNCLHRIQEYVDDASFALVGVPSRSERRHTRIQRSKARNRSRALKKVQAAVESQATAL
jgi:peptidyl-tRNA hydrolase ICT1